jgi:hypothetical protein
MLITVTRTNKKNLDAFGNMAIDTDPFKCVTLENASTLIPAGIVYDVLFMWSNDFQQIMPHVIVPGRTAIEIHWANYVIDPVNAAHIELKGCTAVGKEAELQENMITQSKDTWIAFCQAITDQPSIKIKYVDDFGS